MGQEVYTFGRWLVKDGKQEEFVKAWLEVGDFFYTLDQPPGRGVLVQSASNPRLYYSYGPWPNAAAVGAMRAHPDTASVLGKVSALCEEAEPGMFRVVAVSDPP